MDTFLSSLETVRSFIDHALSTASANMSIDLGIKLVLGYFFIIWGAFIIWVIKDITNRTTNVFLQAFSIFIILFFTPIFWLPVYLLIRPRATLFEQYYEEEGEEYEDNEEEEIEEVGEGFYHCPSCGHSVSRDFRFCPKCTFELTVSCPSCKKRVHTDWAICPYCGERDVQKQKEEKKKQKKDSRKKEKELPDPKQRKIEEAKRKES